MKQRGLQRGIGVVPEFFRQRNGYASGTDDGDVNAGIRDTLPDHGFLKNPSAEEQLKALQYLSIVPGLAGEFPQAFVQEARRQCKEQRKRH